MLDYHLHSSFSGDCKEAMEETILEAIKLGGHELCFTDHLDYDYPSHDIAFDFNADGFSQEFERLKEKYKGQLTLKKGIELGLQYHIVDQCRDFVRAFQPDFVLCSFHVAEKKDLFNGDFFKDKTSHQAWRAYYEDVLRTLKVFKDYSIVSHLDLPKRYEPALRQVDLKDMEAFIIPVLDQIIQDGKGIEVNMSGLRTDLEETLPNPEILALYYERGGRIITIGSDAHRKEDIYSHFKEILVLLKTIGFDHIASFDKMQVQMIPIETLL